MRTNRRPPRISSWRICFPTWAFPMTRICSTWVAGQGACWRISRTRVFLVVRPAWSSIPDLARFTASWTRGFANLDVIEGSAVDVPLAEYTHFYLFNPFDTVVLLDFLAAVEAQATRPVMLAHMSDNGETYFYIGRAGWSLVREGEFQKHPDSRGRMFSVYEHPQHYSIWRFEPSGLS